MQQVEETSIRELPKLAIDIYTTWMAALSDEKIEAKELPKRESFKEMEFPIHSIESTLLRDCESKIDKNTSKWEPT